MDYLTRNVDIRLDPSRLLPGAQSIIVVAWLYRVRETPDGQPVGLIHPLAKAPAEPSGRIARYAWGRDYHRVIRNRLQRLLDAFRLATREPFESRICVDTAPLLERELAQRAGIGWIGNNCLVLSRALGSYFCLGAVLTTVPLATDSPALDYCGTCDRCIKACPTGALTARKQMDPRRCISYQTIERRTDFPPSEPPELAAQVYGCDICQQACPYNGPRAAVSIDPDAQPRWPAGRIDLQEVLSWQPADWDAATQGRTLRRATLEMWHRNARLLLQRSGTEHAPPLGHSTP